MSYLRLSLLLFVIFLAGCQADTESTMRQSNELNLIRNITETRLSNVDYVTMQAAVNPYREKMEFEIWNNYFDLTQPHIMYDVAIAEAYNLVPKSHSIDSLTSESTSAGSVHIAIATLTAIPSGANYADVSKERSIRVYYTYKFDAEGYLYAFSQHHKLMK